MLNFSKKDSIEMMEAAALRFGKEKIAVSLNDFDSLFKQQHVINENCSEIVFMHRLDLDSVMNITDIPCVINRNQLKKEQPRTYQYIKVSGSKRTVRALCKPDRYEIQ